MLDSWNYHWKGGYGTYDKGYKCLFKIFQTVHLSIKELKKILRQAVVKELLKISKMLVFYKIYLPR